MIRRLQRPGLLALAMATTTLTTLAVLGGLIFTLDALTGGVARARIVTAQNANGQRDLLLFQHAVDRIGHGGSVRDARMRRAFAVRQLDTVRRHSGDGVSPADAREVSRIIDALQAVDVAAVASSGDPEATSRAVDARLSDIERRLKVIYDAGDHRFQAIVADALSARAGAQRLLAVLIVLTLVFVAAWVLESSRRSRIDLRAAHGALSASEQRFRSLVQNAHDLTLLTDAQGTVTYASPAARRVLGRLPQELVGRPLRSLVRERDGQAVAQLLTQLAGAVASRRPAAFAITHADGAARELDGTAANLLDDPAVAALVFNVRDVTERRRLEDELAERAFRDSLTGLANRALLHERIRHAAARAQRTPASATALILIDLDDFKAVNDSLGHIEGDRLLVAVARRLEAAMRAGDTVARLGGDEFVILAEHVADDDEACSLAARALTAFAEPFAVGPGMLHCRASLGLRIASAAELDPDDLLRDADLAMYSAKAAGKGSWARFEGSMHDAASEELELRADLRSSLAEEEFVLHFQPIVELADERIVGFEALVRWQHPVRGLLAPSEFIPIAEATGLVEPLGEWVLHEATAALRRLHEASGDRELTMSVNLSPRQLERSDVAAVARDALEANGLAAHLLILEVTENLFLAETVDVATRLQEIRDLGVQLALDDFGTGFSSLRYLERLPLSILKIDRSFVSALAAAGEGAPIVEAILQLARALDLSTVAEGIETRHQLEALRALGCARGQGFLFEHPQPEAVITDALNRLSLR